MFYRNKPVVLMVGMQEALVVKRGLLGMLLALWLACAMVARWQQQNHL